MEDHSLEPSTAQDPPAFWFIKSLVTFVADPTTTDGSFCICKQIAPPGFETPYHTHEAYGEGFCVLEGEVTFFCDGRKTVLGTGEFIYLPGNLPHGFRVSGEAPAAMMIISPPNSTFSAFVREMGEPATSNELPVPTPPDFAKLGVLSAKYGSRTLGPLPD